VSFLRKLARRAAGRSKSQFPEAAIIQNVTEESAPEGSTCENFARGAFEAFRKKHGNVSRVAHHDPRIPKCGKPATVRVTTAFRNASTIAGNYCDDCKPRSLPEATPRGLS
jgi:hypothetical protein